MVFLLPLRGDFFVPLRLCLVDSRGAAWAVGEVVEEIDDKLQMAINQNVYSSPYL